MTLNAPETEEPSVDIRYEEERYAHKNRRISLNASILGPLDQYLEQYSPENFLFECTPRNLEYVLEEAGARAGIRRIQVGFETLRWTQCGKGLQAGDEG